MADPSFLAGSALILVHNLQYFASTLMLPLLLEEVRELSDVITGLYVLPRGVGSLIGMVVAGPVLRRTNVVVSLILAQICIASSLFWIGSFPLDVNGWSLAWPQMVAGVGSALGYVAIASLTFSRIAQADLLDASAVFGYVSSIGASLGISAATTLLLGMRAQVLSDLAVHDSFHNGAYQDRMHAMQLLLYAHLGHTSSRAGSALLQGELTAQIRLVATNALFSTMGKVSVALIALLVCVLFLGAAFRRSHWRAAIVLRATASEPAPQTSGSKQG